MLRIGIEPATADCAATSPVVARRVTTSASSLISSLNLVKQINAIDRSRVCQTLCVLGSWKFCRFAPRQYTLVCHGLVLAPCQLWPRATDVEFLFANNYNLFRDHFLLFKAAKLKGTRACGVVLFEKVDHVPIRARDSLSMSCIIFLHYFHKHLPGSHDQRRLNKSVS